MQRPINCDVLVSLPPAHKIRIQFQFSVVRLLIWLLHLKFNKNEIEIKTQLAKMLQMNYWMRSEHTVYARPLAEIAWNKINRRRLFFICSEAEVKCWIFSIWSYLLRSIDFFSPHEYLVLVCASYDLLTFLFFFLSSPVRLKFVVKWLIECKSLPAKSQKIRRNEIDESHGES